MTYDALHDRIAGALLGAAIGDALGGPVEGLSYQQIEERHGKVEGFLPYSAKPWPFYAWQQTPGTITDDTRLRCLFIRAILQDGRTLRREVLKQQIISSWQNARDQLAREWLEEYALSAQRDRLYVGGYPGNGGMISSLPAALVHPGKPQRAYHAAFEAIFIDQGYARDCSGTHCAIAAAALTSDAALPELIERGIAAAPQTIVYSRHFKRPLVEHFEEVKRVVARCETFEDCKRLFYAHLTWPRTYDALETLGFALGVLLHCPDEPQPALLNAVNLGRDNDSTATVVGGLMGCRFGKAAWPQEWVATVVDANPELDFFEDARQLANIAWQNAGSRLDL